MAVNKKAAHQDPEARLAELETALEALYSFAGRIDDPGRWLEVHTQLRYEHAVALRDWEASLPTPPRGTSAEGELLIEKVRSRVARAMPLGPDVWVPEMEMIEDAAWSKQSLNDEFDLDVIMEGLNL